MEELPKHINIFSKDDQNDILFNLCGVINHNIYFESISPNRELPNNNLLNEINMVYGSYDNFKKEFKSKALSVKGSGYTFLVLDGKMLKIINLLNQDNPYNYGYVPLIGLDMWEHAYYINYENKKDIYINNFF